MFARSLAILGLGISLAISAPAASFAQASAQKTATVQVKKPIVKKKVAKAKSATKKIAKAKPGGKNKKAKSAPEEVVEKPRGLFASLFGGPIKADEKKEKAKAAKLAQAKKRPLRKPVAPLPPLEPLGRIESVALAPEASEVVSNGNNGELRSETTSGGGLMASIFGAEDQMLPQTRALDELQRRKDMKAKFRVKPEFEPQVVDFSGYPRGTIVIDTSAHFLYLVESFGTARRYGIAVGKDGLNSRATSR